MFHNNNNNRGKKKDYSQVNLDDFSDDESYTNDNDTNNNNRNTNSNTNNNYDNNGYIVDDLDVPNVHNDDDDGYMRNQQVLLKQQDEGLDILSQSVLRLGELSNNISEELGQQNKMLDSMETDLETANEDLDIVTKSTKALIKKSGGMTSFCVIAALSMVVLVLLFLILYG
mmetsp:Transcript_46530/g.51870  ORF Transcript_46530/g.51870 Transcript_46530/m.51870 type:complete len:171 (+) Transcript_46530:382-894(+)